MGAETIVFILLIIFALFSVFATNLKIAIICSSVFGVWISFAYLLYHAPDVAIGEAVIASSLGTILYIITIKKYKDITVRTSGSSLLKGFVASIVLIAACILVIYLTGNTQIVNEPALATLVMEIYFANGAIMNPVGSILLNYRVFDTLFEALMLLVSVIAVVHFSKQKGGASDE